MSPDPFFQLDTDYSCETLTKYCESCPQVRDGFCGARIFPDCLRIEPSGSVRVSISATARTWFDTLAQLGDVLHLTRNSIATIGELGNIPTLEDWRNYVLPRDRRGLLTPNLAEYASLWAVREVSPIGTLHGLESRDLSDEVFQRALLPMGTRRDMFEQFVTLFQSPPDETGNWFPPNHGWSKRRRAKLTGRIPWLRAQCKRNSPYARELPVEFLSEILSAAAWNKFPIRTAHYHPALIRTVIWTPQVCEPPAPAKRERDFFHGDGVGLYFQRQAITGVWLWTGQCACCTERYWSIEVGDKHDQLGLAFITGDEAAEPAWRELLYSCL